VTCGRSVVLTVYSSFLQQWKMGINKLFSPKCSFSIYEGSLKSFWGKKIFKSTSVAMKTKSVFPNSHVTSKCFLRPRYCAFVLHMSVFKCHNNFFLQYYWNMSYLWWTWKLFWTNQMSYCYHFVVVKHLDCWHEHWYTVNNPTRECHLSHMIHKPILMNVSI